MRILVVGSGAREDAIVRSLAAGSPAVGYDEGEQPQLFAAPGNPGMARYATTHPLDAADPAAVVALAQHLGVDLVVVGPEAPLVAGVADALRAQGIACFGPSAAAARLEGSKAFAKEVMLAAGVPTAQARVADNAVDAIGAIDAMGPPYVVKNDGLAAGKGVVVTQSREDAIEHAQACLAQGARVVVEEFLDGPEISLFVVSDGVTAVPLAPAQDFKRAWDGDAGPNTGGMGAYSPLPWAPADLTEQVLELVARPTLAEMRQRGTPFQGLLYCGLALTGRGLRVVEFNARFGDPETQVVLPRLRTPLVDVLWAAANGKLAALPPLQWDPGAAVTVVIAAEGYPQAPVTGGVIGGIDRAEAIKGVSVLHAGTTVRAGEVVATGGRVLSVVGQEETIALARERAYLGVDQITLAGSHHRGDIAAGLI